MLFDMSVFLQIKGFREVGIPREVFGALFVVHMRMRIGIEVLPDRDGLQTGDLPGVYRR
jgi:hypothetical protein